MSSRLAFFEKDIEEAQQYLMDIRKAAKVRKVDHGFIIGRADKVKNILMNGKHLNL